MAEDSDKGIWLGLLKWSLAYTDGTHEGTVPPMSKEDRDFLESVMKDGIIDENKRMQSILKEVTEKMTKWMQEKWDEEEEEKVGGLLQELRDCVEQIDFARNFAAMKGLDFLLGCVQEKYHMPKSVRLLCLGILATMSSNNPPVQKQLLEMGSLKTLSDLFFSEQDSDADGKIRARTMQAIGAIVRSHQVAEIVFVQLEQSPALLAAGLGMGNEYAATPQILRQRTLFLLRAIATSEITETIDLMRRFQGAIVWVCDYVVDDSIESSPELREMALAMIQMILEQGTTSCHTVLSRKDSLVALGVRRVSALRKLTGEEKEYASVELEHWEANMVLLARSSSAEHQPANEKTQLLVQ
mmetsp:Transcript_12740/g.16715  ORF Transcript_12740/g.16715 Transcript_12740/m.16715 type:complete len:355 (-) Transcript_12740:232-1296(-)|eukprot:CAMPEP_0198140230 /NCGR_PEP_ID=MMETSP1443-20131203/3421_1 /TAXON_ID=186043 /ORGANISM="Entomoneis sp., Strain CCMP2396" /LENGTH=354 /DNA_ID=CAMNT_0043802593 /DNA_START=85 /DNA_END=1149 /DNA_ORIENTATION=-